MNFRDAMDALGLSAEDVGSAIGRSAQHVRQMRLDPAHPNFRSPPRDWRQVLGRVVREKCAERIGLAEMIEREGEEGA
jgi:hypothetical protein